jgi:hypothetical protein
VLNKRINKYLVIDILGAAIYGAILFFGFTLIAGFSLLLAYLWNFLLIILALVFDGLANRVMQSDDSIRLLKDKYGADKAYLMLTGGFLSFKTLIYLFYLFILVASQIIDFNPTLVSKNLVDFINANNYSILFLLAFDTVIKQFIKDKEKAKKLSDKFKENQD